VGEVVHAEGTRSCD